MNERLHAVSLRNVAQHHQKVNGDIDQPDRQETHDYGMVRPQDLRILLISVKVKLDQSWQEAINVACPDTPHDYTVRIVGDLYVPTGIGVVEQRHTLLNYPEGNGRFEHARAFAERNGLKRTVPREVFAIGRQYPRIYEKLGQNPVYIVETTSCTFDENRHACCMWWIGSKRSAGMCPVSFFATSEDWFAFREWPSSMGL